MYEIIEGSKQGKNTSFISAPLLSMHPYLFPMDLLSTMVKMTDSRPQRRDHQGA